MIQNQSPATEEPSATLKLRLAIQYWLDVSPYIKGRRLEGTELCIARDAHNRLQIAKREALEWNHSTVGRRSPVPLQMIHELDGEQFREPQPLFADEKLTPEKLAIIAAPLVMRPSEKLDAAQAVRAAHGLLIAAEDYVRALPENKPGWETQFLNTFQMITFDEIIASMGAANSGQLPFLPGVRGKQAQLTMPSLRRAVRDFMNVQSSRLPRLSEQEMNDNQAPGNEFKKFRETNQITLQTLCEMRWRRFVTFRTGQRNRRAGKKAEEKP